MLPDIYTFPLLAISGLVCYAILMAVSAWYARVTHWQPPAGNQANDWTLRRQLGLILGGVAIVICSVGSTLWLVTWPMRFLTMLQAALLAAAGASDLQRFHLPLPLTILGAGAAVAGLLLTSISTFYLLFALVWVVAVITLHALVSKGSMQLGDHIATVWIALASPVNGMFAIALGDVANVIFVRVKGLQGKKVAAAGAWLICTTAIAATPPYFAWINGQSRTYLEMQSPERVPLMEPTPGPFPGYQRNETAQFVTPADVVTATVLLNLSKAASEDTASVAMEGTHAGRVRAAQQQAGQVKRIAELAKRVAPSSSVPPTLDILASALNSFDLEEIRNASQELAAEREYLIDVQNRVVITDTD
ncbi:MAG TPA: hypothetical protein VGK81_02930 [Anaerolineae bacterium]